MKLMHDPLRKLAANEIVSAVTKMTNNSVVPSEREVYDLLVEPPNPEMGDLAFGCFTLAKTLRKGPPHISKELIQFFSQNSHIQKVEAVGPYVNFHFTEKCLGELILDPILNNEFFNRKLSDANPKTMVEYSQPNTHKELHVGHMRNIALGLSLVRLMRFVGYEVISSTFPGDMGTHVAKCLWYLKYHNQEPVPQESKGEWIGRMYSKGNIKLEDELGTPQEEINRKQLTEIIKQIESKSGEFYQLWKETREWSIDLMKEIYKWADVDFDQWYWESEVDEESIKWVKELYQQGKLVESEGAIGMDLKDENLGFCILIKSDGTGLYATKDLELARRKFRDFQIERSIYVVDTRQALHFQQVFKTLERLGFEQAKNCYHLQYNFVELPDGAMSSRKGNIVPLTSLIEEMESHVKTEYLSRYKNEWSQDDVNLIASQVAKGAIMYGMLKMDPNKKIVFDMKEWLKLDGESGPFIQYAHARISSLEKKLNYQSKSITNWSLLTHVAERRVLQHLMHFNNVTYQAVEGYRPSVMCSYLYDLAKKFNLFYHECPIGTAESEEVKNTRLALAHSVGMVLKKGLWLIGMPAPEKM